MIDGISISGSSFNNSAKGWIRRSWKLSNTLLALRCFCLDSIDFSFQLFFFLNKFSNVKFPNNDKRQYHGQSPAAFRELWLMWHANEERVDTLSCSDSHRYIEICYHHWKMSDQIRCVQCDGASSTVFPRISRTIDKTRPKI